MTLYNLDPSVSLEKLYQSFVTFGDIKDIRCVAGRPNAKLIEYYDGELSLPHRSADLCGYRSRQLTRCTPQETGRAVFYGHCAQQLSLAFQAAACPPPDRPLFCDPCSEG